MGFIDDMSLLFDRTAHTFWTMMGGTAASYCSPLGVYRKVKEKPIKTKEKGIQYEYNTDTGIIYCADWSVVSFLELRGAYQVQTEEEKERSLDILAEGLRSVMGLRAHAIQVCIYYNPDGGEKIVKHEIDALKNGGLAKKIDLSDIMDQWTKDLGKHVKEERIVLALWTFPSAVSNFGDSKKRFLKENAHRRPSGTAPLTQMLPEQQQAHEKFLMSVRPSCERAGLATKIMDTNEALWFMRYMVDEEMTSEDWKPTFNNRVGQPLPLPGSDAPFVIPNLSQQLFPRDAEVIQNKFVRIGNRLHAPMYLTLAPQIINDFNLFLQSIQDKRVGWRICWTFHGAGQDNFYLKINASLAQFLYWAGTQNKGIVNSVRGLTELQEQGEVILEMKGVFDVFIDGPDTPETTALLNQYISQFVGAYQTWGTQEIRQVPEDPFLGFCSSIPGMYFDNPGQPCLIPLRQAVSMFPVSRAYSPWEHGGVLRTIDGKIFPYKQQSSVQASWLTLGVAPMGGGKSVRLNTENLEFVLSAPSNEIPFLSIIDIGPSSLGLINLLKHSLPPDLQYLVMYSKLQNSKDFAINIFDLPLGARHPLPAKKSFLIDFLCLLATPLGESSPVDGVSAAVQQLVTEVYRQCDEFQPKVYTPNLFPELDKALSLTSFNVRSFTTWHEVTEALFLNGYVHEAEIAHHQAMPLLFDAINLCNDKQIMNGFQQLTPNGTEPLAEYIQRKLREALQAFPVFQVPTVFDLGDARIVSLNLQEVVSAEGAAGERQAGIFFLLANHVLTFKFQQDETDVYSMPPFVREYHSLRIDNLMKHPKKLCIDEFHRVKKAGVVLSQIFLSVLNTLIRESRKWRIMITLYSQSVKDFDPVLWELASAFYVHGSGTSASKKEITEAFGMGEAGNFLIDRIGKPDKEGARFLAFYKADNKALFNLVVFTLASPILLAFSSTREDAVVRDTLYKHWGVNATLWYLSKRFPYGVKTYADKETDRKARLGLVTQDVYEDIIQECLKEGVNEIFDKKD